jgi:tRNA (guanine37-N1)-methyltransferase
MRFDVFTLFPEVFNPYLNVSILERAQDKGLVEFNIHNIRDWATDKHHTADDEPYGGGGGMVMKAEPIFSAVESVLGSPPSCPVILMTPQGRVFNQKMAKAFAQQPRLAFLAGRYEGLDERVRENLVTDEVSIGDYVLTGGELPALVMMDAITRLLPGALGDAEAPMKDSHAEGLLEYPHYTRPADFRGWEVPEILRSGNHALIDQWRHKESLRRTWERRPELLQTADLTEEDWEFIHSLQKEKDQET